MGVAALVPKAGKRPTADDVGDFVAQVLPPFKRPTDYLLVEVLPRTEVGRLDRDAVRRDFAASRGIELVPPVRSALDEALPQVDALEDALTQARARLDPGPFRPEMTVHAAHARHPGVQAIFARRGLPGCPDCPVGADESLAEAAAAEGFAVGELLRELEGLAC